jgi:hypothetical protein
MGALPAFDLERSKALKFEIGLYDIGDRSMSRTIVTPFNKRFQSGRFSLCLDIN